MIGGVYPGLIAPGQLGFIRAGILTFTSGVLNVTTSDNVLVSGSIRLFVEAGATPGSRRPVVDATYLRNFPRHRDGFGHRR